MSILQIINGLVVSVGIPTIVVALIYIGRKLQTLDDLNDSTGKMKHNMKVVGDYLTRHHSKFNPNELHAFSPLQLTEAGNQLIHDIGFNNVFETNRNTFLDFIDNEKPKLKYDVETVAIKSVHAFSSEPFMEFLKVFFYNNPDRNLANTAPTLGIYIRDEYLKNHPEITQ